MSIVSSTFKIDVRSQVDGRCYVTETHTDHLGAAYSREYLASVNADHAAIASSYAAQLVGALAEGEFEDRLGNVVKPIAPQHQTLAQFAARLRARFLGAEREEAARIATWLLAKIAAAEITDLQARTAFGLATSPYNTLKAKLVVLRDHWAAVQAARGE